MDASWTEIATGVHQRRSEPLDVRWVANTHAHFDHSFGNQRLGPGSELDIGSSTTPSIEDCPSYSTELPSRATPQPPANGGSTSTRSPSALSGSRLTMPSSRNDPERSTLSIGSP
jgi:hypothetical protein